MRRNKNSKENLKSLLERSLLRNECTKMTKFITESKSSEEDKRKNNNDDSNNKAKEATKNLTLQEIKTMKHGIKFFPNINLPKNQLLKNHQPPQLNCLTTKLPKIKA